MTVGAVLVVEDDRELRDLVRRYHHCCRRGPARSPARPVTGTLADMPVPTRRCKDDAAADLDHHAELHWTRLGGIGVRWRGGHGYVIGYLDDNEPDLDMPEETMSLCRIGYLGSPDDWAFALYDPATGLRECVKAGQNGEEPSLDVAKLEKRFLSPA